MSDSFILSADVLHHAFSCESAQVPQAAPYFQPDWVSKSGIVTTWAKHQSEVREAQKLRYEVFAGEMGAKLPEIVPGYDIDIFDDYCEHLLVRDRDSWQVIGTYRVLTPAQARLAGRLYSDSEFDLTPLQPLRGHMAELGRSCVHKHYRHGGVIMALWKELVHFMMRSQLKDIVGCVSIPMNLGLEDGKCVGMGHAAASIWRQMHGKHLASSEYQVKPRCPLPLDVLDQTLEIDPPALMKGYLRVGAKVLGAPAWDSNFNTADLPMLMRIDDLPSRYRKHFLG
ncbi:MAG: GNAT family N-acetyltransferase [Nitrosomonas sp.]|nr:GNAT family N-acetyltransferase [Nitrosomonas sp.]